MVATAPQDHTSAGGTDRFLLTGITWDTYERLLDDLEAAGRRFKLTYDCGDLEIEMPLELHEIIAAFISQLVEQYMHAAGIPFMSTRATTWKRRLKEKGLEADESYYVQHVDAAESVDEIDIDREPPPDLAIEAEVTKPLLPKLPVYAGIGVPEIWHAKGDLTVKFLKLEDSGNYVPIDRSIAIPFFTPLLLSDWLRRRMTSTEFKTVQAFRSEVLAGLGKPK